MSQSMNNEVSGHMGKLSINPPLKESSAKKDGIMDSWEDDHVDSGDSDAENAESTQNISRIKKPPHLSRPSDSIPSAPPPTPMSPRFSNIPGSAGSAAGASAAALQTSRDGVSDKRPEKTTQIASRMIAAGLGVKSPKQTEEQKEYDKAVREKEMKALNQQREEKKRKEDEKEKANKAMWDG